MEKSRILNATKWSVICEVIAKIISPITTMILARLLSQEVFGIVASITAITSLADLLTDAGFNAYIIQHQFENDNERKNTFNVCFWSNFVISMTLYVVIFINRELFSRLVGAEGYADVLVIACLVLPLTSISSIEQAIMKKELMFKNVGFIKVISKLIPFITTIPLALLGFKYWSLIIGTLVGEVVNALLSLRFGGFVPKLFYSFSTLNKIFSFSIWAFMESILEWLLANIAILTIGGLFGTYYLGIFKTGMNIISQITTSVYSLYSNVYKSAIAKEQNNLNGFKDIFLNFQKFTSIISIPIGIGAFLYRDLCTNILLGEKWYEATTLIGLWGLTSMMSIAFGNFYSDAIRAKGYPKKLVFVDMIYLAVILIILFYAENMEFEQFCIYFCLAKIIQPVLQIIVGVKTCHVNFLEVVKNCFPQIISVGVMTGFVVVFKWNTLSIELQIVSVAACIVIYFIVFFVIYPDKKYILNTIKGFINKNA